MNSLRTRTAVALLTTVTLTAGCGGAADKLSAARSDVAGAAAAASSAEAAIAALSSKLGALTSATPAAVPPSTPAATPAAVPSGSPAAVPTSGPPPAPSTSTGGLPTVPSGAALSSLLGTSVTPSATPAAPASGNLAGALASANALLGGALSQVDVSKQCAAIPIAQVQALVKAPITGPANFPLQCGWKGTDLHVSLSPNDTDQKNYKDLLSTEGHAIPGLGDAAQWFQPVNGVVPDVNSRKGTLTCYVEGVDALPSSTMPYAGKDPFFTTKLSDALAYANKEAKLCADIFAVSKT